MLRNRKAFVNCWFYPTTTMLKTNMRSIISLRKLSSSQNANIKESYDVIIAGGGMVGCTLACAMGSYKYQLMS